MSDYSVCFYLNAHASASSPPAMKPTSDKSVFRLPELFLLFLSTTALSSSLACLQSEHVEHLLMSAAVAILASEELSTCCMSEMRELQRVCSIPKPERIHPNLDPTPEPG